MKPKKPMETKHYLCGVAPVALFSKMAKLAKRKAIVTKIVTVDGNFFIWFYVVRPLTVRFAHKSAAPNAEAE